MFGNKVKQNQNNTKLDSTPITTVIGQEVCFEGNVTGENSMKVDGKILGNLQFKNGIILGEQAYVNGNVDSSTLVVFGSIDGNVNCAELYIKKTGKINGDVHVQKIEIEAGGKINGKISMNSHQEQNTNS